jgi:hypothetical protein
MPAIHLFQRRTLLGGDDLQIPALSTIFLRLVQGCCFVVPLAWQIRQAALKSSRSSSSSSSVWDFFFTDPTYDDEDDDDTQDGTTTTNSNICHNSHLFPLLVLLYLSATVLFLLCSSVIEIRLLTWTCHGTPTEPFPRSYHIESLMELKLLAFTVLLVFLVVTSLAAAVVWPTYRHCHAHLGDFGIAASRAAAEQQHESSSWSLLPSDGYYYNYFNDQDDDDDKKDFRMTTTSTFVTDRLNLKNHRFGSRVWWLGYSLLGLSQVAELVLTMAFLLSLLCKPPSSQRPNLQQQQLQQQPVSMRRITTSIEEGEVDSTGSNSLRLPLPTATNNAVISSPLRRHYYSPPAASAAGDEERLWATRCHTLCSCLSLSTCFIFGGRDLWRGQFLSRSGTTTTAATAATTSTTVPYYYNAVARALADYLETFGVLDVVPTDLVMGLVVLQRVQRQRVLEARLDVLYHQNQKQQPPRVPQSQEAPVSQASGSSMSPPTLQMVDRTRPTGTISATYAATSVLPQSPLSATQHNHVLPNTTTPMATKESPNTTDTIVPPATMMSLTPPASTLGLRSRTSSTADLKHSNFASAMLTTPGETVPGETNLSMTAGLEGGILIRENGEEGLTPRLIGQPSSASCRRRRQQEDGSMNRRRQRPQLFPDEENNNSILQRADAENECLFDHYGDGNYADDGDRADEAELAATARDNVFLYKRPTQQVLNSNQPQNVRLIQDGAHFARYALSIYTWLLYLYVHPISGVPKLLCGRTRRGRSSLCATAAESDCSSCCCLFCRKFGHAVEEQTASASVAAGQSPRRRQSPPHQPHARYRLRTRRSSEDDDENQSDASLLASSSYQQQPPAQQSRAQSPSNTSYTYSTTFDDSGHIAGDTVCDLHKHSLLLTAEIDESELVYAHFWSSLFTVPYCILLDHATQSLVVSVRGTLSLEDLVTDVDIDPEPLEPLAAEFGLFNHSHADHGGENGNNPNPFRNQYAHGGVVACVRNLYKDLVRHQLLERILLGSEGVPPLYPTYTLTLVGHSLGGAACSLLSYLLQPRFPSVRVWSYSPPGCTLTWELATRCQDWTTTFVLDSDLVPRLSLDSLEWLRNDVLQLIGRVKVPKYQIIHKLMLSKQSGSETNDTDLVSCPLWPNVCNGGCTGAILETCCCCCVDDRDHGQQDLHHLNQTMDGLLHPPDQPPPDTHYQRQLHDFFQIQEQRKSARGTSRNVALYPPGRMIHLVKTGEDSANPCVKNTVKCITCNTTNLGSSYTPVWISNDDLEEIVVSPTMGTDHFVDRICAELEGLAKEYTDASTP